MKTSERSCGGSTMDDDHSSDWSGFKVAQVERSGCFSKDQ